MKKVLIVLIVIIVLISLLTSCFMFEEVEIKTSINGTGVVTLSPESGKVFKSDIVTVTADAAEGWTFIKWTGGVESLNNPITLRANQNMNITAHFTENITVTLSTSGNGQILVSPVQETYPEGTMIQCAAIPEEGSYFSHWNDETESTDTNKQFIVTKEEPTIYAHFEKNLSYAIEAQWNSFTQHALETPLQESPFARTSRAAFPKLQGLSQLSQIPISTFDDTSRSLPSEEWEPAVIIKLADNTDGSSLASAIEVFQGEVDIDFSESGFSFQRIMFPERTESELSEILEYFSELPEVSYAETDSPVYMHSIPNDEYYPVQWNFKQLNLPVVWDRFYSLSNDVIVAVVDTEVDIFLSDLAQTQFVSGYDFVNNDPYPIDDEGHGSHVTGTIAQSTNNTEGVAGFSYESKIMPVKVLGDTGSGTNAWVAQGIVWSVLNGADIINLSLGSSEPSELMADACEFAYKQGVVVISSSGNSDGPVGYPAALDSVYAVGASDSDKERAPYSCYGPELDIIAPGGNTEKTLYNEIFAEEHFAGILQQTKDGKYYWYQGTSMAAPHVSALASLILKKNPTLSPSQVMDKISDSADDLGDTGRDDYFGNGLINPLRALDITSKHISDKTSHSIAPHDGNTQYWELEAAEGSIEIRLTYNDEPSILHASLLDGSGNTIASGVEHVTGDVFLQAEISEIDDYYLKVVYDSAEDD
jgi:hypothetical protein